MRLTGGLRKPKNQILGADIAGQVEAVGTNVTQFRPGDEVFGDLSPHGRGGFAEYVAVPESALTIKPVNLSFARAAAVPMTAVTALQGLRDKGQLQAGQQVLINGASGGAGLFRVQRRTGLRQFRVAGCILPDSAGYRIRSLLLSQPCRDVARVPGASLLSCITDGGRAGIDDPNQVALMGNFHVTHASPDESWVTVGEWMPRDGYRGDVLLPRIHWSRPNRSRLW